MIGFFSPKWVRKNREVEKAVRRFLNFRRDVLPPKTLLQVERELELMVLARKGRDERGAHEHARELSEVCGRNGPKAGFGLGDHVAIRENVEVIFVTLVILMAIKGFLLQPFMIPTGSMQPTLNGVKKAEITYEEAADWNVLESGAQFVLAGRRLIDEVVEEPKTLVRVSTGRRFRFFSFTRLDFADGSQVSVPMPARTLMVDFGLGQRLRELTGERDVVDLNSFALQRQVELPEGFVLAQGVRALGDQVFVNRMAYHFVKPKRGEVFVFTTNGIAIPGTDFQGQREGQHYIKRLVGLPGDKLTLVDGDPRMWVNDELAQERGMQLVGSQADTPEGRYSGYVLPGMGFYRWPVEREGANSARMDVFLDDQEYMAMGDNSPDSLDSRRWGPVPEENVVGPALLVYWPFHSHWGWID